MTILEFFNIYDYHHLEAFECLISTGTWPEGFIPDDMKFEPLWHIALQARMADAWARYRDHNTEVYGG